ncbi:BQ2448_7485 [Microbotryum intermedium]|uniref:BQ2448_7485 protein n=1 Tax=Microbotryum intermedium TaxID=269621 RepID=A0A238FLA5_9BASI|nr:BQ2448_7485 [Microbotryum intermedium]
MVIITPWWSPVCSDPPFSADDWDLSPCVESELSLIPVLVLALIGGLVFPRLWRLYRAGERYERGGRAAYTLKQVLAVTLIAVQLAYIVVLALHHTHDRTRKVKIAFGVVTLLAHIFALVLAKVSHPLLPHSSTPILFFTVTSLVLQLVVLRTTLLLDGRPSRYHSSTRVALFILSVLKIVFLGSWFGVELLGPNGWEGMTWRDFAPFAGSSQGRIRLAEQGDESTAREAQGTNDEEREWKQSECPRLRANIFQRLTFSWMTPMMKAGYHKYLTEEDLWALPPDDTAEALGRKLETAWKKRCKAASEKAAAKTRNDKSKPVKPSLAGALAASYGGPFFSAALFKLLQDTLSFTQPQLLRRLLRFVETYKTDTPEPAFHGYIIAFGMFVCAVTQTTLLHCYFARVFETGMRVRAGLVSLIYKKSLVLSNDERGGRSTGDIVNLMSTDATRLQDFTTYGQIAWSGMFQITLAFISLYQLLGFTMLVGVAVMVLSMPLTAAIARYQTKLQRQQMKNKDKRTSIMSEILNNIRSIKLYAWEDSFAAKLFDVRNNRELVQLRKMGYLSSASTCLWSFTPFLVAFSSFSLFSTISGKPLTAEIVFPAITLFSLLGFPLAVLPVVFSSMVEAYVSVGRLGDFLTGKELQDGAVKIENLSRSRTFQAGDELVSVVRGEFAWNSKSSTESILSDINLSVKKGELLAVVGRVGSGKSSLLSAILGEMTKIDGSVTVRGTVAYCAQQPWIMGGSVRSNIVFGHKFDQEFYDVVIAACALKEDLAILPQGDETEVGEKGISLSGGQKARVALARAVYARADVYLLDDPLSAVDAHVAKHLFDKVLGPTGLLCQKARLLCTNAIPFCQEADELVFLRRGIILERGTYASAIQGDTELSRLLIEFGKQNYDDEEGEGSGSEDTAVEEPKKHELIELSTELKRKATEALSHRAEPVPVLEQKRETLRLLKRSTRPKEKREQGSVKVGIYKEYIKANGYLGVGLYMSTIVLQQILQIGTNVWLKNWAQHNSETGDNGNLTWYLAIYAAFGVGASLAYLLNGLLLYSFCVVRAAKLMHDRMFNAVMRSPMLFFETTPLGTILNRFSRGKRAWTGLGNSVTGLKRLTRTCFCTPDVYVVDEVLARVFGGFFRTAASVIGMIVVISAAAPAFLFVLIPIGFIYKRVQTYYLATSRELKRLDATTKSPIFASFQETLGGVATIRAYRQSARFIAENEARVDRNQEAYFPSINCNRWLAVRLEFLGSNIIFFTALLCVIALVRNRNLDAGLIGIALSYALSTTQTLNWIVRSATEVETNIVSVERVQEYIELKPEAPLYVKATEPDASWPQSGSLTYDHIAARYRENLDLVLRDVSFDIKGGEKVGVCGRTGSGKSTLTMVLYRVIEAEQGVVSIDGVDVSKIGLHCLRSRMSIIPQDSQCFEGNLRENLDPAGTCSDSQLWAALEQCRLKEHVESMEGKLDAHIDEGGSNLSSGQRQLLCLGRALLRKSKILVLDEATAAVDPESDKEMQSVIRREFADCTIFVIAHRLNTILDCDKIICMDAGKVAEFDTPANLLADPTSMFYSLANEAGVIKGTKSGSATPRSGTRTPARKD